MYITFITTAKEKGGGLGGKENPIHGTAAFMLTLPGKILDISALKLSRQGEKNKEQ